MDTSDAADTEVVANSNIPTEEKVEQKRRPGRPRKNPQIPAVPKVTANSNGESTSGGKRGRGRPPKAKKDGRVMEARADTPDEDEIQLKLEGVEDEERKKPGRPRKSPEKIAPNAEKSETSGSSGKKRGRPTRGAPAPTDLKEKSAEEESSNGQQPKKKRGRPPMKAKVVATAEAEPIEDVAEVSGHDSEDAADD